MLSCFNTTPERDPNLSVIPAGAPDAEREREGGWAGRVCWAPAIMAGLS